MTGPTPHLLVALTAHGFGHTSQTAPVVNALRRYLPVLRLTLRCDLPRDFLATRFEGKFDLIPPLADFGMVMDSALAVNVPRSLAAYAELHEHWERQVRQEALALTQIAPDVVLANASYLTLAGAAAAAIPAYALSSLNWADIYRYYAQRSMVSTAAASDKIHGQILAAYRSARVFLQTTPCMPMSDLPNRRAIGVVARQGVNRRAEIDAKLHLTPGTRIAIIAAGGFEMRLPLEQWPPIPGIHWLVSGSWGLVLPQVTALESLNMHFIDLLCSSDVLIGKPGYGSFSEAAVNDLPVLYTPRRDWPEESYLVHWLKQHGRCLEIDYAALERGDIAQRLQELWRLPPSPPVSPDGIESAASLLLENWREFSAAARTSPL